MESEGNKVHVNLWRTVLELGSGKTGSVALCVEPISPGGKETNTCGDDNDDRRGVFHAVKRVPRRCITSGGAAARVLREKNALQALKGVGLLHCFVYVELSCVTATRAQCPVVLHAATQQEWHLT